MKKLLLAIVAAYIVLMLTNYLVHQVWLMSDYAAIPASHRPGGNHAPLLGDGRRPIYFCGAIRLHLYARRREKVVAGAGCSLRHSRYVAYGGADCIGEYVVYIVPYQLAIKWMIAGGIQMIILGLLVAGICTESTG